MNEIGYAALLLAFVSTGYGTVASIVVARTGRWAYVKSAERAVYAYCASVSVAGFAVFYALLRSDFSNEYVCQYTCLDLAWFYKASAFWAGNSVSTLLSLLIVGIFGAIVIRQNRTKNRELIPYVISIISFIGFFFALLMLTSEGSNPFAEIPVSFVPENGAGLKPMLENPGMVVHPVTLYLGYVGFAIPFAFAMGALVTKRLGDTW